MAGLALDLWLEVTALPRADDAPPRLVEKIGEVSELSDCSLLLTAFAQGARLAGASTVPTHDFRMASEIPLARGLGSSGAAVAAGLLLGAAWARTSGQTPPDDLQEQLLQAGYVMEGHPDNVVASLRGGCTFGIPTQAGLQIITPPVHDSLAFVVAWGKQCLTTQAARAALPAQVAFADAVENPRRLLLLLEGLREGNHALLALAENERLHARFRLPLIPGGQACLDAAHAAGASFATVSGAGAGLLAICPHAQAQAVAEAMKAALEASDPPGTARVAAIVHGQPKVEILPGARPAAPAQPNRDDQSMR